MTDNFTLLIAGPYQGELICKNIILNGEAVKEIVVSHWEGDEVPQPVPDAVFVSSPMPGCDKLSKIHNSQNIYLQTLTVLAGLERVRTPYVIKARSDEFFSNLCFMLYAFNSKKLLISNIFVRDVTYRAFHISDHLFVGRTDLVMRAFIELKRYIEDGGDAYGILNSETPAEVKIGLFYLEACGYEINCLLGFSEREAFDVMRKQFDIFDVDLLRPLQISSSMGGRITSYRSFVRRDSVLGLRHITQIDQMSPQGALVRIFQRVVFKINRIMR